MASGQNKTAAAGADKGDFANPVLRFVNRVVPRRSERILLLVTLILIVFCGLSGPFGTFALPLGKRVAFWAMLMGVNALLWASWFRLRSDGQRDWRRIAAEGAILFTLPMPLEISSIGSLIGVPMEVHWPAIWLYSTALGAVAGMILLLLVDAAAKRRTPKGLLWREGYGQGEELALIRAEDHFCRLIDLKGREKLVYARFADLETEVATLDGLSVRRGCWVAAKAVAGTQRVERKWVIELKTGDCVAVPEGKVNILREAGWI